MDSPVILWFRDDLRLADHPALLAAVATGRPLLPLYILDKSGPWPLGGAARWWLHHSLTALGKDLRARGGRLVLRRGAAADVLRHLTAETGAETVFAGATADPRADRAVAERLAADGVRLRRMRTATLFGPDQLKTKAGGFFNVYPPFLRAAMAQPPPPEPVPAPDALPPGPAVASDPLVEWHLLPTRPDWASGLRDAWTPGEAGARKRLDAFLAGPVSDYETARNRPEREGSSRLSPHLRFGEISAAQVLHGLRERAKGADANKFAQEVMWREFSHHLLWHRPEMPDTPLRPAFAAMPWRDDPTGLRAWRRGRTGVPIVDAGMRQLWDTGWMHNRVRMITASFLVKHLLIDWRIGESWFWDTLVDADLGNNALNWQWIAGSGTEAAPFFRVFNPVTQGRTFDPDGVYIKRFVPELRRLDPRHVHAPWEAPAEVRNAAGLADSPWSAPVVDLAAGRARALAAFAAMRGV